MLGHLARPALPAGGHGVGTRQAFAPRRLLGGGEGGRCQARAGGRFSYGGQRASPHSGGQAAARG
eukprot:14635097-Alexandrium_andersonii.AAC.1